MHKKWRRIALGALLLGGLFLPGPRGLAYINQVDGTVLPVTGRLQACLDRPVSGESTPGAVDAIADAAVLPEAFRPILDAASGHYRVTFLDIGEGAGFRNSYGWFWIGEDVTVASNLHTVFGCRTYATCDCPCSTTRTRSIDFDTQPGFAVGRPIGFWLRTPERLDGSREDGTFPSGCTLPVGCDPGGTNTNDSCGGRLDTNNRIYFTSQALNDDGDFVHFLVYESVTHVDTFYFGFEDLFRGGDNDFEDMLVRASGLVPLCSPQAETCNGADDDCDGATDEGITRACSTRCGAGVETCAAGSFGACSARVPGTETCEGTDEDCDGSTDEGLSRACSNMCGTGTEICITGTFAGCSAPTPTIESCNNRDDDCDGTTDESLTRPCSSACGSGVETCSMGRFGGCTAPTPGVETCDNTDEDCDGRTDEGLTQACTSMCGTGTEVCVSGAFVGCTAPRGTTETCNDADDDCDGMVDEGLTRACSTSCGVGTETCVMGVYGGCDAPTPGVETCNNIDDDCNGIIDDGNPGGGATCVPLEDGGFDTTDGGVPMPDGGSTFCLPGRVACIAGELACRGASSTTREVCNCEDDDCDGNIDEDPDGTLCGEGVCVDCACRNPCRADEFPCPPGQTCDRTGGEPGYCVPGRCAGVMCADSESCNPETGACEDLCAGRVCADGFECLRGACVENNCYAMGCPVGELCRAGACAPDPCVDVSCPGETSYCRDGACVEVCDALCPTGQSCRDGTCQVDACNGTCRTGQTCVDGECLANECTPTCGAGRVCRGGTCVDNPCRGVRCPDGTMCVGDGQCFSPDAVPPPVPDLGLAAGGCNCDAAGASGSPPASGWIVGLLLIGLLLFRRRASARAALVGAGLAATLVASGCATDPYCFSNCDDGDGGPVDAGVMRTDARVDGCVSTGEEECNERDDDCDGVVDEDFDLSADARNCSACGVVCMLPDAFPTCVEGVCQIESCAIGHHDLDGAPANGCEYECPPSGAELCDTLDNDCDGATDEDFDLTTDLEHCGSCGNTCVFANAGASCVASACEMGPCNTGFVDLDGDPATGCEYRCTAAGAETCNRRDDNCDGMIDETFDLTTDVMNCGECGRACTFLNAVGVCAPDTSGSPACSILMCAPGFHDIDGDPATGCEYPCVPSGGADTCDGTDDDCDGSIDEADPAIGTACGTSTGSCMPGVSSCQRGAIVCVGGIGPQVETCNGLDDNCDGTADNGTLAGVGDRCGATNVGRCEFGTTVCTAGAVTCGGAFVGPVAETCNGTDDDCNGATDDGLTPPPRATVASCAETRGVCAGRTPSCRGAAGWGCDLPATFQATESLCDTLDNDCDGTPDENCLAPLGASDTRVDLGDTRAAANSINPHLAGDGGTDVWLSWMDLRNGGTAHAFFARSTNSGGTWSNAVQLDTAGGPTFGPLVAWGGGTNVAAVWGDFRGGTNYREIFRAFSSDDGGGFIGDAKVNTGSTSTVDSFNVEVASSGSNVYAVWETFVTNRQRHIFFARSTNGGNSWSVEQQLSTPGSATFVAANPQIAAAGANVYVVWRDNRNGGLDLYLRRSTNSGASFGSETRIDTGDATGSNTSFSPSVAAEGSNAYVAWVDDRDMGSFDIWLNRTQDAGATWRATSIQLDADTFPHDSIEPHVVAPQAGVAVVTWIDYRFGFSDVVSARSADRGDTWSTPQRLDTSTGPGASGSYDLAVGAEANLVVAAWADDRAGLLDIYANFSLDGGVTWQPQDYRLDTSTLGTSDSENPFVYVGAATAHVVWEDHRTGAGCTRPIGLECPESDLFYRRMR
ncbi:MAG: DUF4114 domain-containing protein [Sandaracinaceae bacterium]|nr:DUF4114 domain-containing protein [Sandaracinaceae bacterium]